jgi:hypothetical protein
MDRLLTQGALTMPMNEAQRRTWWKKFRQWLKSASDLEMEQLQASMQLVIDTQVRPVVCAVHQAIENERARAFLPKSLLRALST